MDNINQSSDSEYLGITEAADYLRVSASTLRRWEKKGFLVPERTPTGIRRYTKKQLDDVIQTPAYEKPTPAIATYSFDTLQQKPPIAPPQPLGLDIQTVQAHIDGESVEEYIHVVENDQEESIAQHTIDSQVETRPASYTSLPIEHSTTPPVFESPSEQKREVGPFDSFSYNKGTYSNKEAPIKTVPPDNFATVEQHQFNHIFDIHENEMEEQVELEEYDTDAAYVNDEPHTSTYTYDVPKNESPVKSKKTQSWMKPVFLFVSLFLAIVILSLVAWFALSSSTVSGAPLNAVID